MKKKLLLVDDEPDLLEFLSYNLDKAGYEIHTAQNGMEAISVAKNVQPDLILLDVMMPEMDGMEVCTVLREEVKNYYPLIAFLTSRSEDYSQIAGFDAGADDYITKPIRPRVLVSRVEALVRRSEGKRGIPTNELQNDSAIQLDRDRFLLILNGKELQLPKKEFDLLELLKSQPGKVFTRDQILSNVWGNETIVGERTIDVHIRKLREKIGDDYIRTIKGVGYTYNEK